MEIEKLLYKTKEDAIQSMYRYLNYKDNYKLVGIGEGEWDAIKRAINDPGNDLKIIFLDIDGVLNNYDMYHHERKVPYKQLIPACVKVLNDLIAKTNAKVVISSTWRMNETKESLLSKLQAEGYEHDIYDFTPELGGSRVRGNEIKEWLDANKNVVNYVILDDDSDMLLWQKDHFLWVDGWFGLTPTMAYKAEHILNNPSREGFYHGF